MLEPSPFKPTANSVDRRPEHVAATGFLIQVAAFGTLAGVAFWAKSDVAAAVARFVLAGIPIWGMLHLAFKQARRVRAEELETAELLRARDAGLETGIFEVDHEALLLERGRLQWMIRWLLPATSIVVAVYLLAGHFAFWRWSLTQIFDKGVLSRTHQPTLVMWFVVGVGFICFLYARYALALARLQDWKLLHAGASAMAGNAVACLGLVIALMAGTSIEWAEPLLAYIVRVALVVLGIELGVNLILDMYRPRTPGDFPRPSFDSRLLGLISEPGGVAKSIADAVNYQFGFEVSSTWFYQLLQRWLLPITVATAMVILLLTGVVIVDADEAAVVERFGVLQKNPGAVLEPGLHFKLPFPIDVVYRAPIRQIQELVIGEASQADDKDIKKAIVWTEAHDFVPELMLPVASPTLAPLSAEERAGTQSGTQTSQSTPVSLLMVSVPIEYRIKDLKAFLHNFAEPLRVMEATAYQYLSEYAAGVDVDQLIGPGREHFNQELRQLIQRRLDELGLGIELVFAGIRGAHPPVQEQVAQAFQGVIAAQIKRTALVYAAEGEARRILTAVAGTEARAKSLDEAILERDRKGQAASPEARDRGRPPKETGTQAPRGELGDAEARVRDLLMGNPTKGITPMSGQAAGMVAAAQADAREWIGREAAKLRAFETEVAAFRAAPSLYPQRKLLEMYMGLDHVRKYLIVGDPSNVIIEYETAEQGGLDRVLNEAVDADRKKRSSE